MHPSYEGFLTVKALEVLLVMPLHVTPKLGLVIELVAALLTEMGDGLQVDFVDVGLQTVFAVVSLSTVWKKICITLQPSGIQQKIA